MENYSVVLLLVIASCALTESYPNPRPRYGYDEPSYVQPYADRRSLVDNGGDFADPAAGSSTGLDQSGPTSFSPFAFGPLSGFMQSMQEMMRRVQMQMGEVLSRMPPQDIDWAKLGNTTSHTQTVNNHVVTVNETTYHNADNNSSAVFHIRIVDVKPTADNPSADTLLPISTDIAYTDIPEAGQHANFRRNMYRSFLDNSAKFKRQDPRPVGNLNHRFVDTVDNSIDVFKPINPNDLSRDTLVNNVMRSQSKSGLVMIDPDAELIDVHNGQVRAYSPLRRRDDQQQRREPIFT